MAIGFADLGLISRHVTHPMRIEDIMQVKGGGWRKETNATILFDALLQFHHVTQKKLSLKP